VAVRINRGLASSMKTVRRGQPGRAWPVRSGSGARVDPRGRIVCTEAVDSAQPAILVDTVRQVYASRVVPALTVGHRPTPYVWVPVPAMDFRISD
jgi:hypothetical protein